MLKKLVFALYVFQVCACAYLQADDTYWDARLVRLYDTIQSYKDDGPWLF